VEATAIASGQGNETLRPAVHVLLAPLCPGRGQHVAGQRKPRDDPHGQALPVRADRGTQV